VLQRCERDQAMTTLTDHQWRSIYGPTQANADVAVMIEAAEAAEAGRG